MSTTRLDTSKRTIWARLFRSGIVLLLATLYFAAVSMGVVSYLQREGDTMTGTLGVKKSGVTSTPSIKDDAGEVYMLFEGGAFGAVSFHDENGVTDLQTGRLAPYNPFGTALGTAGRLQTNYFGALTGTPTYLLDTISGDGSMNFTKDVGTLGSPGTNATPAKLRLNQTTKDTVSWFGSFYIEVENPNTGGENNESVEIGATYADDPTALTGTIRIQAASPTSLEGSATSFTTQLSIGSRVKRDADAGSKWGTIASITSNTLATFTAAYAGTLSATFTAGSWFDIKDMPIIFEAPVVVGADRFYISNRTDWKKTWWQYDAVENDWELCDDNGAGACTCKAELDLDDAAPVQLTTCD